MLNPIIYLRTTLAPPDTPPLSRTRTRHTHTHTHLVVATPPLALGEVEEGIHGVFSRGTFLCCCLIPILILILILRLLILQLLALSVGGAQ